MTRRLLLLLLLRLGLAMPPCPAHSPCQCTDLRMKCVQSNSGQLHYLDRVPYFVPSHRETRWSYSFHELRVRNQAMTELSLRYAWGVLNVKKVEVTNSLVRRLAAGAFSGLRGVESLNLSHNLLSSVRRRDLQHLNSLRELVLHNNRIKAVDPLAFSGTELVSKLYLSHNLLAEVPAAVRSLPRLTHLYLQYNNISVIRNSAFSGLRHLIILDLGGLQSQLLIEDAAFCGIGERPGAGGDGDRGLVALYLRSNVMRGVNLCALGRLRGLRGLNLTGSIFPCSCEALSFANRVDWQQRYGFAPRFVTFESWQLINCDLDCPPAACVDVCGNANADTGVDTDANAIASADDRQMPDWFSVQLPELPDSASLPAASPSAWLLGLTVAMAIAL